MKIVITNNTIPRSLLPAKSCNTVECARRQDTVDVACWRATRRIWRWSTGYVHTRESNGAAGARPKRCVATVYWPAIIRGETVRRRRPRLGRQTRWPDGAGIRPERDSGGPIASILDDARALTAAAATRPARPRLDDDERRVGPVRTRMVTRNERHGTHRNRVTRKNTN